MIAPARCPNPACGRASALADDRLGRVFRCTRCGTRLPRRALAVATMHAPAPAGLEFACDGGSWGDDAGSTLDRSSDPDAPAGPFASPLGRAERGEATPAEAPGGPARLGRFRLHEVLGSGSFATVYRAHDPDLDRDVAVKVLHPGVLSGPAVARLRAEARALARLRHPRIVPVYDAGEEGGRHYLAMACLPGRTLADRLDAGPIGPRHAAGLAADLAEVLDHAHRLGVVHRDVKPANILLDDEGGVHLTDFGLAHRLESDERLTRAGAILGTPGYIAPERARGEPGAVSPAVDQYALGVVLYELLCGRTPFQGPPTLVLYDAIHRPPPPPRSLRPEIPGDLETICLKALAKHPEGRYPDCGALADDVRRWLGGEPIRARRPGSLERVAAFARREPALAAMTTLAAAGLVASTLLATTLAAARGGTAPATAPASATGDDPGR